MSYNRYSRHSTLNTMGSSVHRSPTYGTKGTTYQTTYGNSYNGFGSSRTIGSVGRPLPTLPSTSFKRSNAIDSSSRSLPMKANHALRPNQNANYDRTNYSPSLYSGGSGSGSFYSSYPGKNLPPLRDRENSLTRTRRSASTSRALVNGSSSNNKNRFHGHEPTFSKKPAAAAAAQDEDEPDRQSTGSSNGSKRNCASTSKYSKDSIPAVPDPRNRPGPPVAHQLVVGTPPNLDEASSIGRHSGCRGLNNLGNTCYMNAALQCLANTRPLKEYFMGSAVEQDLKQRDRRKLVLAVSKLIRELWAPGVYTRGDALSPTEVKSTFCVNARRFQGYGQHDSQEFLILLLEEIHEEINRKDRKKKEYLRESDLDRMKLEERSNNLWAWYKRYEDSIIVDLLVGQLRSALKCTVCDYVSDCFDPYWGLALPVKKVGVYLTLCCIHIQLLQGSSQKLNDCFRMFMETEILDRDEKPTCAKCKQRQKCTKTFTLWRLPKYLMIHLKRFEFLSYGRHKINSPVDYPMFGLNLEPYMDRDAPQHMKPIYNLYGVVCHEGSASSGHYYAYCRHPENINKWFRYNDSVVSPSDASAVQTPSAYILFYELADLPNNRSPTHSRSPAHL